MPVVPTLTPNTPGPAFDTGRGASPDAFGASVGRAMSGFGQATAAVSETLGRLRMEEDKLWLEEQYTAFTVDWAQREATLTRQIQAAPGSSVDSHILIQNEFEKAKEEFMGRVTGERQIPNQLRQGLGIRVSQLEGRVGINAVALEQDRISRATENHVVDRINLGINEVMSAPDLFESRRASLLTMIDRNREALGARAIDLENKVNEDLANAHVLGKIKQEPTATLQQLHDGVFDGLLTPDDKARAIASGYRELEERARQAERAAAEAERAEARRRDQNFGAMLVAIARNQVNEDFLVSSLERGNLNAQDFRTLMSDYRRETSTIGDESLFTNLKAAILFEGGSLQDVMANRDRLTESQVVSLMETVDQVGRRGGALALPEVDQARRHLAEMAAGQSGPFAVLDRTAIARKNRAIERFDEMLAPDGSNYRSVFETLVDEYKAPTSSAIDFQEIPPIPGFERSILQTGTFEEKIDEIRRAKRITDQQAASGEISFDEQYRRIKILDRARQFAESRRGIE